MLLACVSPRAQLVTSIMGQAGDTYDGESDTYISRATAERRCLPRCFCLFVFFVHVQLCWCDAVIKLAEQSAAPAACQHARFMIILSYG